MCSACTVAGGVGLSSAPNVSIVSLANGSHIGSGALACADLNGDGIRDLVIGSPFAFSDVDTVRGRGRRKAAAHSPCIAPLRPCPLLPLASFPAPSCCRLTTQTRCSGGGSTPSTRHRHTRARALPAHPSRWMCFRVRMGRGVHRVCRHTPSDACQSFAAAANLTANGSNAYAWLGYAMAVEPGVALPAAVWRASLAPALEQANVAQVGMLPEGERLLTEPCRLSVRASLLPLTGDACQWEWIFC